MNRQMQPGDYAICVAWDELGIDFRDGQFVHVERSRGGMREVTIKKVKIGQHGVELWPDSDDPAWQTPVALHHTDEDTEVVIRGLVIGTFRHFG